MKKRNYFFFLVGGYWPLIIGFSLFNMLFSLLLFIRFSSLLNLFFRATLLVFGVWLWLSEYRIEFNFLGFGSSNVCIMVGLGVALFILSEVIVFASLFWSYFHFFLGCGSEMGLYWPPVSIIRLDYLKIPFLNTLLLLSSRFCLTYSHYYYNEGKFYKFYTSLWMTIVLGFLFLSLQLAEYSRSYFSVNDSIFGRCFFVLTGLHGFHVLLGAALLLYFFCRTVRGEPSKSVRVMFELFCWYWHFVDLVWLYVFTFLYYLFF